MSLSLQGISKSYGATRVLAPLTIEAARGELIALLGPSGCGKTTTLRIVAGLESPDSGTVRIGDADVTRLPPERRGLGMVFQQYAVWPHRDVAGNVAYPLERSGVAKTDIAARVKEALALVHLDHLAARRPDQLSGGQLQRVALARALVARPPVLLLDEPLSNLDALLREEMRAEIRSLQRRLGITTVLVTHDQAEALAIADRVVLLNGGLVEQAGTPEEIYRAPATAFVARFVGGGNVLTGRCDGRNVTLPGGTLPAPAGTPPGECVVVCRPEDLRLDEGGHEMTLAERLYLGDRVELRLEWGGVPLRAVLPAAAAGAARPGERVRVAMGAIRVLPANP